MLYEHGCANISSRPCFWSFCVLTQSELLDHMVFSWVAIQFNIPSNTAWEFWRLHILINTCYFLFLLIAVILMGVVLICISLMISDVEPVFVCFLALCISSLEKWQFRYFAQFLIMFCCQIFWYVYILGINSLSNIWFASIFPILWIVFSLCW